ncbi:MAG: hypothetical protein ACI909_003807, partial [Planctomycetota bacterium]
MPSGANLLVRNQMLNETIVQLDSRQKNA